MTSSLPPGAFPNTVPASDGGQLAQKGGLVLLSGLLYSVSIASVSIAARAMSPLTLSVLRLVVASVILGVILAIVRPQVRWRPRLVAEIFLVGLANVGLPFVLLALSLRFISSSLAAILFNLAPPITLLMAHFTFLGEIVTLPIVVGTLLLLAGIWAVNSA